MDETIPLEDISAGLGTGDALMTGSFQSSLDLLAAPGRVGGSDIQDQLLCIPGCFGRLTVRTTALVTKALSFAGTVELLVTGLPADFIILAQGRKSLITPLCGLHKSFSLFHNSVCLPRHLTHILCLSDALILAKTVTYVSSLSVTYLTSLYTVVVRGFCAAKSIRR